VFTYVMRDPVKRENTILIASDAPPSRDTLLKAQESLPPDLRQLALNASARLAPALRGGPVYTDDRAPVEWLVDTSIVHEAAEK
jgi:hypothetical protein